jgi:transposase
MDGIQQWPPEMVRLIRQLEQRIKELEEENKELKKRITHLENTIRVHENPHTPPSQIRFKGNVGGATDLPGKRGAPPGHRGATREKPKPDEIIPVMIDRCPQCGSFLGDSIGVESRTIEEIPPPQKTSVIRYDLHKYMCPGCGYEVTATHNDCPKVGNFGVRLMTLITMAKFHQRGVIRRIQQTLWEQHGFAISPKGIHDVLL